MIQTILLVAAPVISIIVSSVALFFSIKRIDKDKVIQQACDLAQFSQRANQKNGNKLSSADKKRVAVQFARQHNVKISDNLLSKKIQAQLQRRIRNA